MSHPEDWQLTDFKKSRLGQSHALLWEAFDLCKVMKDKLEETEKKVEDALGHLAPEDLYTRHETRLVFPPGYDSTPFEPPADEGKEPVTASHFFRHLFPLKSKSVESIDSEPSPKRQRTADSSDDTDRRNLTRNWQDDWIFQPVDLVITAERQRIITEHIVIAEQRLASLGYSRGGVLDWQRALLGQQYQMLGQQRVGLKILVRTLDARGDVELHDLAARSLADVELHMMYITTLVHPEALEAD